MTLGFDKPLHVLPFDHRGSFRMRMFGSRPMAIRCSRALTSDHAMD
jgi:hypothetical protein